MQDLGGWVGGVTKELRPGDVWLELLRRGPERPQCTAVKGKPKLW